jgi:hypothetical protein
LDGQLDLADDLGRNGLCLVHLEVQAHPVWRLSRWLSP